MDFSPRPGCPICSIVSEASQIRDPSTNPPKVLWQDDSLTAYLEQVHPVSSQGHVIIALNLHVPSIYTLSSTDLPLLVNIRNIAQRLLGTLNTGSQSNPQYNVGFINPPFKDTKIPVTDHLHCHAYVGPANLTGWWRGIAYSSIAWYPIDDLIAEIRETVSNNRVKSGCHRKAPIDDVPQAGSRSGTADGKETSLPSVAVDDDLEQGT
ncbi:hypothetical protein E1B28_001347 [Marasmius oreades]|uniref:HIT domain-containing protein n=1 Tax=Marasmius oreades TaxID=181124 RepID=A0A9P7V365_9AGAR|nr:uncharacterized protein E1B28_001347 [Marasmius oreades]KAG7099501.1 hypothetical protein E1B28_001347 [Marasmius oreades]